MYYDEQPYEINRKIIKEVIEHYIKSFHISKYKSREPSYILYEVCNEVSDNDLYNANWTIVDLAEETLTMVIDYNIKYHYKFIC